MNRRRALLVAVGACVLACGASAQERRPRRIGFLGGGNAETDAPGLAAFRQGMAALGWVEGTDYVLDDRYAEGVAQALPDLAARLIATRPDVVLTTAEPPARALIERTTIPVVFVIARDPIAFGLAKSLQRPGGTATGLISFAPEVSAKRVQLLREAFPSVSRIAAVFASDDPVGRAQLDEMERAARTLGIRFSSLAVAKPADIAPAFAQGTRLGVNGYVVASGVMTSTNRKAIVDAAARSGAPAIYPFDIFPLEGGLLSYGAQRTENYRRGAGYVDKILKGARPGDLPIEQPTQIELVINMRTARAQGLSPAPSVLLRADRVIQ